MRLAMQLGTQVESGELTEQEAIAKIEALNSKAEKELHELMGEQRFSEFEEAMLRYGQEMVALAEAEGEEAVQQAIGSAMLLNDAITDQVLDIIDEESEKLAPAI